MKLHLNIVFIGLLIFVMFSLKAQCAIQPAVFGENEAVLFSTILEWTINNASGYSGNAFDVSAWVTFTHTQSGEQRKTQMFFDGSNRWKFRFTGTRTGQWVFSTNSSHIPLNSLNGSIQVFLNSASDARGFIKILGNKFVRQMGDGTKFDGLAPNIWMNYREEFVGPDGILLHGYTPVQYLMGNTNRWKNFLSQAWQHGCNGVQILPQRDLIDMRTTSNNPNISNFHAIEMGIIEAHNRNMFVHIFTWGDEERNWHPPDGINSNSDKRLNRYIAARLGPLPGWKITLGFDLGEWVTTSEIEQWAAYLKQHLGWIHPIGARKQSQSSGSVNPNLDIYSTDYRPIDNWYTSTITEWNFAPGKPMMYERRFTYLRNDIWTMDNTRQAFWAFTLAGGASSVWGHFPLGSSYDGNYPNPEQLHTHLRFWKDRFRVDLNRNVEHSGVISMKNSSGKHWILYGENKSVMDVNLSGMSASQPAVAVDTKLSYSEINLGTISASNNRITLPYRSDWAIAVGNFNPLPTGQKPEAPSSLRITN